MTTSIEIPKLEEMVLFDSSVSGLDDFPEQIFNAQRYVNLDVDSLNSAKESLIELLEFILMTNTFTVKAGIVDFKNVLNAISAKQEFLNKREVEKPRRFYDEGKRKRLLFDELSYGIFQIYKLMKSKIFKPKDMSLYSKLYVLLPYLLAPVGDLSTLTPKHRELFTSAFYLSLTQESSVALVVKSLLLQEYLMKLTENFSFVNIKDLEVLTSNSLQSHPIKIYSDVDGYRNFRPRYTTQK